MKITIRSEEIKDYFSIAEIHAWAFDYSYGMGEVLLVDSLRHRANFDKDLSLIAEVDGRLVGHVVFSPQKIIVKGTEYDAVVLAPIAVHPIYQNKGIGTLLVEEGLKRSEQKGYAFSLLLGNPKYYSKFGYQSNMYGTAAVKIARDDIGEYNRSFTTRRVRKDDLSFLTSAWQYVYGKTNLAIKPSGSILNWISPSKRDIAVIVEVNSEPIGYIKYDEQKPEIVKTFLAKNQKSAETILGFLNELIHPDASFIVLPIHPNAESTHELLKASFSPILKTWEAGMLKFFKSADQNVRLYEAGIKQDIRNLGLVLWPVEFDHC